MSQDSVSLGLIAAVSGGLVGAVISSSVNLWVAQATRRNGAAEALWRYQFSLLAFASQAGAELVPDEVGYTILKGDLDQVQASLKAAYPHACYLSSKAKRELFTDTWIGVGAEPDDEWYVRAQRLHDDYMRLAKRLELELLWRFPRRFGDRIRGVVLKLSGNGRVA